MPALFSNGDRDRARELRIALKSARAQYCRERARFPVATPNNNPISLWRQKASRCAAGNDIQPRRQGWNAPASQRVFSAPLGLIFSFLLGATSSRAVCVRFRSGERMTSTMADRQRREFLQLTVGGALAASLTQSGLAPAAAEPLGQPTPFASDSVLKMAVELASKPFKEPEAPAAAGRPFRPHFRAVRGDPARAGHRDLERPETGLLTRAVAPGLRLHDSDRASTLSRMACRRR